MDVQLRGQIKSTKVGIVRPKEGAPYIEGTITITFPVDNSEDLGTLADIQEAGAIVADIQSIQFSMPGVAHARRMVRDLADAGIDRVTVKAGDRDPVTVETGARTE